MNCGRGEMSRTDKCHSHPRPFVPRLLFWNLLYSTSFTFRVNGWVERDRKRKELRHPFHPLKLPPPNRSSTNSEDKKRCFSTPTKRQASVRTHRWAHQKLRLNGNLISWGYGSLRSEIKVSLLIHFWNWGHQTHIHICEHSCDYCHVHIIGLHTFLSLVGFAQA